MSNLCCLPGRAGGSPGYARELEARRDNLADTIAALEQRTRGHPSSDTQTVASVMENIGLSPRQEESYDLAI
jgi:hypothetical protein